MYVVDVGVDAIWGVAVGLDCAVGVGSTDQMTGLRSKVAGSTRPAPFSVVP